MSKQEKIMQLLESGKIIRLIDGRCGSGFVDMPALTALINQRRVKVYDNQGVDFVRAYTPAELLALEAAKVAALKQVARVADQVLAGASSSTGDNLFVVSGKLLDKLCEELNNVAELLK